MTGPVIDTVAFDVNADAHRYHGEGLRLALDDGNYPAAHERFAQGLDVLAGLPRTIDTVVQAARLNRDDGFTSVREGIADRGDYRSLYAGRLTLVYSASQTGALLGEKGLTGVEGIAGLPINEMSSVARQELLAEHGATLSLLGRTATVQTVLVGTNGPDTNFKLFNSRSQRDWHRLAHTFLRDGSNGYYRVNNAMTGARADLLADNLPGAALWLGRAMVGLGWTAMHDHRNLLPSILTVGNRIRHLPTRKRAVTSVLALP